MEHTFTKEGVGKLTWELPGEIEEYFKELRDANTERGLSHEASEKLESTLLGLIEKLIAGFLDHIRLAFVSENPKDALVVIHVKLHETREALINLQRGDNSKVH